MFFEIYGKKMKAKVMAESPITAQEAVKNKMIFHKVVKDSKDEFNQATDMLEDMIDMLGVKRK